MRSGGLAPFGSGGGIVEADETFIGREPGVPTPKGGIGHKMKVLSLLDRTNGRVRSMALDNMKVDTIAKLVTENVATEAHLMTDEAYHYGKVGVTFASHGVVRHKGGEYVSFTNPVVHSNTIKGYFSIFKLGMKGVYQHCAKHHLTAIWPSSISGTATAWRSAWIIASGP